MPRAERQGAQRDRPHNRPPAPGDVRLSVVLPAYHEPERIGITIERVRNELGPIVGLDELEVVVVDDGSGDGTAEAAAAADQVIAKPANQGKGAAVRSGALAARGRCIAFTDADLSYAPSQIVNLLEAVEQGWDVVIGNRYHQDTTTVVKAGLVREMGGRLINGATRLVLDGGYADTQCGLKAFRSDVARMLFGRSRIDGFAFDVELLALVERFGLSLREVPVEVQNSDSSTVRVARDAAVLLRDLARIRRSLAAGRYDAASPELDVLGA